VSWLLCTLVGFGKFTENFDLRLSGIFPPALTRRASDAKVKLPMAMETRLLSPEPLDSTE